MYTSQPSELGQKCGLVRVVLFCELLYLPPLFTEYVDQLRQYSPTYSQWAGLEEELEEPLKAIGNCVEQCSKQTEEHIHHLSDVLVPALHDYVLCAETLKVRHHHTASHTHAESLMLFKSMCDLYFISVICIDIA